MEPDARGLQPPGIAPPARWDLIVIGAGAAGLLAATRAAERGKQVLLLEKNRKPGVKILMSGGTRCNLTHDTDRRGIVEAFGSQGKFLHSPLAALGPKELIALFHTEGVATKVEETGKVFPVSNRALDVLMALRRRLDRSGATLSLGESVAGITREGDGFHVTTSLRTLNCQKLLITTGGQSYPGCGTTGDAYRWLADLGHTIVPPRPALVPITSEAAWVRELSGVTIPDVGVKVIDPADGGRVLDTRRGSFLFTHFGLSGPVILDASRVVTGHAEPRRLLLECDFLPALTEAALDQQLREQVAAAGKKQVASILPEAVPRRLVESILAQLGIAGERRAAELSKTDRARLLQALKRSRVPVSGTRGFTKAEVTAGGVSLDEVDSRTMQSKLVPGLLLAGEVLDLDGPIGGYNFQAAFSTGWLAAERL